MFKQPKTDDGGTELKERIVHLRLLLPAASQSAELVQPTDGAFNDPAEPAQAAAMAGVPPADHRLDAARP